jgi:glycerol-3-phosphate dehydrogenase (NAD(P)+)
VRGVELGGSVKNVIAIAAGVVEGMGFGYNTQAALITRGLAEITRLGAALGAEPRHAGRAGGDRGPDPHLHRRAEPQPHGGGGAGEGELAGGGAGGDGDGGGGGADGALGARPGAAVGVEMPIVESVYAMLYEGLPAREAVEQLMLREPKAEQWG